MTLNNVERFIKEMKGQFPEEISFVFYRGYCYWFAFILASRFKGEIWFNPKIVHFATKVRGTLYDVYGKVNPGYSPVTGEYDGSENKWVKWSDFQINHHEAVDSIVDSCIKKI